MKKLIIYVALAMGLANLHGIHRENATLTKGQDSHLSRTISSILTQPPLQSASDSTGAQQKPEDIKKQFQDTIVRDNFMSREEAYKKYTARHKLKVSDICNIYTPKRVQDLDKDYLKKYPDIEKIYSSFKLLAKNTPQEEIKGQDSLYGSYIKDGRASEDRCITKFYAGKHPYFIFGVFDGHGGEWSSEFAKRHFSNIFDQLVQQRSDSPKEKILEQSLILTHILINKHRPRGNESAATTATVAVIDKDGTYIGISGDSPALLSDGTDLSQDHTWGNVAEMARLADVEDCLLRFFNGNYRIYSSDKRYMEPSRSLGDTLINPYIIPDPHITKFNTSGRLLIASDGIKTPIRDVGKPLTTEKIFSIIGKHPSLRHAAKKVVDEILDNSDEFGRDDITAIVIDMEKCKELLQGPQEPKKESVTLIEEAS